MLFCVLVLPSGGKVLTAEELEASLTGESVSTPAQKFEDRHNSRHPHPSRLDAPPPPIHSSEKGLTQTGEQWALDWGKKFLGDSRFVSHQPVITQAQDLQVVEAPRDHLPPAAHYVNGDFSLPPPPTHSVQPVASAGKMTTVSELEASLKDMGLAGITDAAMPETAHMAAKNGDILSLVKQQQQQLVQETLQRRHQQQQQKQMKARVESLAAQAQANQQQQPPRLPGQPENMEAFNKFIGIMKASGTLKDTPKMPVLFS